MPSIRGVKEIDNALQWTRGKMFHRLDLIYLYPKMRPEKVTALVMCMGIPNYFFLHNFVPLMVKIKPLSVQLWLKIIYRVF